MSDFLTNLISRASGQGQRLQPVIRPHLAPQVIPRSWLDAPEDAGAPVTVPPSLRAERFRRGSAPQATGDPTPSQPAGEATHEWMDAAGQREPSQDAVRLPLETRPSEIERAPVVSESRADPATMEQSSAVARRTQGAADSSIAPAERSGSASRAFAAAPADALRAVKSGPAFGAGPDASPPSATAILAPQPFASRADAADRYAEPLLMNDPPARVTPGARIQPSLPAQPLPVADPAPSPVAPVIEVTIGRVEVRAVQAPARRGPAPKSAAPAKLSLEDYLRGSRGGR